MPTYAQIVALAQSWGADSLQIFGFVGANRRLPNSQGELQAFITAIQPVASADNLDLTIILGYLQESRASTSSITGVSSADIISWAQSRNYFDVNGKMIATPIPGSGFPDGSNVGTVPGGNPGPTYVPPPSSSPINITLPTIGGLQIKPIYVAGAVAAVVGYSVLTRRRR